MHLSNIGRKGTGTWEEALRSVRETGTVEPLITHTPSVDGLCYGL